MHGVDAAGQVVIRRQLKRRYVLAFFQKLPPCLIGIEACASSYHWSRELQALGHTVRLMPPAYVKPYVKRQKNDATDAEAICEAVARANMRFVPTKTPEEQSCLMLHRTRHLFYSSADCGDQFDPGSPCRIWHRRAAPTKRASAFITFRSRSDAGNRSGRQCCSPQDLFRSGRNFSAWIGLVPKQHSSGGKDRLGSISKQDDRYLRSLFVAGALAVIR